MKVTKSDWDFGSIVILNFWVACSFLKDKFKPQCNKNQLFIAVFVLLREIEKTYLSVLELPTK